MILKNIKRNLRIAWNCLKDQKQWLINKIIIIRKETLSLNKILVINRFVINRLVINRKMKDVLRFRKNILRDFKKAWHYINNLKNNKINKIKRKKK